jgi:hypothetical protein
MILSMNAAQHNNTLPQCRVLSFIYCCAKCRYTECHYAESFGDLYRAQHGLVPALHANIRLGCKWKHSSLYNKELITTLKCLMLMSKARSLPYSGKPRLILYLFTGVSYEFL